ncbi:MAG: hypothetical protein ACRDJG_05205 [Actinomycetota bacterium]
MDLKRKTKLARAGLGLILGTLSAGSFPSESTAQARFPDYRLRVVPSSSKQEVVTGDCQVVDAHGVPLYDSQFEQRTGHKPCE